jgi:hypothetical protein
MDHYTWKEIRKYLNAQTNQVSEDPFKVNKNHMMYLQY